MNASLISVETYLTVQIQEIAGYGALHSLTWARKSDPDHWLQLSVHGGDGCYLMVQCLLPEGADKRCLDAAFDQFGWVATQVDQSDCLIYYLARCGSYDELRTRAADAARRCAEAMFLLWGVTGIEELALLGARGPRLSLHHVAATDDTSAAHAAIAA
jgi:hypothetical protein